MQNLARVQTAGSLCWPGTIKNTVHFIAIYYLAEHSASQNISFFLPLLLFEKALCWTSVIVVADFLPQAALTSTSALTPTAIYIQLAQSDFSFIMFH